jgi:streptogramin lyase
MKLLRRLLIAALVLGALVPTGSAAAAGRAPLVKSAWSSTFPQEVHGTSVAIGPGEVPWFGISVQRGGLPLAHVQSQMLEVGPQEEEGPYDHEAATALQFDSQGNLWFATYGTGIDRRDPSGSVTKFELPKGEPVSALTIGPEGDVWFTRGGYGEKSEAQVGRMTPAGAVTQFPLEPGSHPASITVGPDGALWFSETEAGKIGRITTGGEVQLFPLSPKVHPQQIVAGPDGALWFGENAQARRYGKLSDRVGRITTGGQVHELPIPFGKGRPDSPPIRAG